MRRAPLPATLVICAVAALSAAGGGRPSAGSQVEGPKSAQNFARIDQLVADAIAAKAAPGVVVLIGRADQTVYEKAYGARATVPSTEPMTLDTVFDLASLT